MLAIDFSRFPELRTERLLLRELEPSDAKSIYAMRSDERVMRHIGRPRATSLHDASDLIESIACDRASNNGMTWGMQLAGSIELIGTIGFYRLKPEHFTGEVGYLLHPDHWGRGLMSEALDLVTGHIQKPILPKFGTIIRSCFTMLFQEYWIVYFLQMKIDIGRHHLRLVGEKKRVYYKAIPIIGAFGGEKNLLKSTKEKLVVL